MWCAVKWVLASYIDTVEIFCHANVPHANVMVFQKVGDKLEKWNSATAKVSLTRENFFGNFCSDSLHCLDTIGMTIIAFERKAG